MEHKVLLDCIIQLKVKKNQLEISNYVYSYELVMPKWRPEILVRHIIILKNVHVYKMKTMHIFTYTEFVCSHKNVIL